MTRDGDALVAHSLVIRGAQDSLARWVDQNFRIAWAHFVQYRPRVIAIEAVEARHGKVAVAPLLDTAAVVGVLLFSFPEAELVAPKGFGKRPLEEYPKALRPKLGKGAGHDMLRHCRAAYDCAGYIIESKDFGGREQA